MSGDQLPAEAAESSTRSDPAQAPAQEPAPILQQAPEPDPGHLPELDRILALARAQPSLVRVETLAEISYRDYHWPIYGLVLGPRNRHRPTLGLFGGVHGLEQIGSHVVLSYLESFVGRLSWDNEARRAMQRVRIVAIPVVNPGGIFLKTRSNPQGIDLMRNAPVEAELPCRWPLLGGQRISSWLPWYRGKEGELAPESKALIDFVRREMFAAQAAIALDVHSGYGTRDRLWYPYAKTDKPIADELQYQALASLLDRTLPHHVYVCEPQSAGYTTHGDLWDYLYDLHLAEAPDRLFLPWTLELGSWNWVRKNPRLLFFRDGMFNPRRPHRVSRENRRHLLLFDFLLRAVRAHTRWKPDSSVFDVPDDEPVHDESDQIQFPSASFDAIPDEELFGG